MPNGAYKSKAAAGKFRAEGLKAGVPDVVFPFPRWPFHGLFIEMKKMGEQAKPEQRIWQLRLIQQGYAAFTCQGKDNALAVIRRYLALDHTMWGHYDAGMGDDDRIREGELEKLALNNATYYVLPRAD